MSVKAGQEVAAGDQLLVLEAMKMQTPVVAAVNVKVGQSLQPGDKLVKVDVKE